MIVGYDVSTQNMLDFQRITDCVLTLKVGRYDAVLVKVWRYDAEVL